MNTFKLMVLEYTNGKICVKTLFLGDPVCPQPKGLCKWGPKVKGRVLDQWWWMGTMVRWRWSVLTSCLRCLSRSDEVIRGSTRWAEVGRVLGIDRRLRVVYFWEYGRTFQVLRDGRKRILGVGVREGDRWHRRNDKGLVWVVGGREYEVRNPGSRRDRGEVSREGGPSGLDLRGSPEWEDNE